MSNRKILFRGKREDNGKWVYGYYTLYGRSRGLYPAIITGTEQGCVIPAFIVPETRGEYTGLTDKNGTKIFEGDILNFCYDEEYTNYEVIWFGNKWLVLTCGSNGTDNLDIFFCQHSAVIGNIYDNPELLKECGQE